MWGVLGVWGWGKRDLNVTTVGGRATPVVTTGSRFPHPPHPQNTHTCCVIARQVKVQPDDGQNTGPKHVVEPSVVVYPLHY